MNIKNRGRAVKLTSIVLLSALTLSCKLGEIDVNAPAYSCTADGYQVDAQGVIIIDQQGLALQCS